VEDEVLVRVEVVLWESHGRECRSALPSWWSPSAQSNRSTRTSRSTSSSSARVGYDICEPKEPTAHVEVATPYLAASTASAPPRSASASPPANASPAPVVSSAGTRGARTATVPCRQLVTQPPDGSFTCAAPIPRETRRSAAARAASGE